MTELNHPLTDLEKAKFVKCKGNISVRTKICQEIGETVKVEFSTEGIYENNYSEQNSIAKGATVNLINHTVPVGNSFKLQKIDVDGDCMGTYEVKINGNTESKKYTYYTKYGNEFLFLDLVLLAGDVLLLTVKNRGTGAGNFNSNYQGRLI